MALTPSLARRALAVSAAAAVALVALAIPASAHTGQPTASCDKDTGKTTLKVDLTAYNANKPGDDSHKPNTIKVTDGAKVLLDTTHFGTAFPGADKDKGTWVLPGDVDHNFTVEVNAWDHVAGKDNWSFTWEKKVEACVKKQEQPPSSQPSQPSSAPSQPSSSAPTTTTTAAAVVASTALADTGASIGLPLAIGALLLIGGIGMLILVRRRRKV
jgi:LPXTG-motif cell wall-anchored protein